VHAVSRAVRDLLGSGVKAELVVLAPGLADIQSAAGRRIKPPLAIGGEARLSIHSEAPWRIDELQPAVAHASQSIHGADP
jgi:hypothetical protein